MSPAGNPGALAVAFNQALGLFNAGRMAECESVLGRLLAEHPGAVEALELLGAARGAQGRPREALEALDRARALRPSSITIRHNRAQALFALGRLDDARTELDKLVRMHADYQPSWNLLGSVLAGLGDVPGAERAYRRAMAMAPEQPQAPYNLGLLFQQAGRLEEAIAAYRGALRIHPAFAPAHNNLANALKATGRADEAVAHYREALRHDPGLVDAMGNLGTALREAGRYAEAIPLLERAEVLRPGSPEVLNSLGIAYYERHRHEDAAACYRRALALRPAMHEARNNLGNALAALGQLDEAAECFRAVLAQSPDNADAHSNLGLVFQERERDTEAIEQFERALAIRPDHADALNNLGYLLQEGGRRPEAMEYYRRAMQANPRLARAGYNLGLAHLMQFEFDPGWKLHELRFATAPPVSVARAFAVPAFAGRDWGKGERVAIWPEQGVGDQILYSTLVDEVAARGEAFVLEADRRPVPAFARAHPTWTVVAPEEAKAAFAGCSRHVPLGTLPLLLRPSLESFERQPRTLLAADAEQVRRFRSRSPATTRVVGISWRSFQPKGRGYVERKKSAPLDAFMALSRREGLHLVDLQYGDTAAEREAFARRGGRLHRHEDLDLFHDLDGVLAAIEACDVVVTTSNVTAHLAGALGKRTLLVYLAARPPFHYWAPRADGRSLWYPSLSIVTGPGLGTWDQALARVHELIGT